MNHFDRIENEWNQKIQKFSFLMDLGFSKSAVRQRYNELKEIEFISKKFMLVIGMHYGRDENYIQFLDAKTRKELPYPLTAIQFFLPDYETTRRKLEEKSIRENDQGDIEFEFYRENTWVFTTDEWASNVAFLSAIEKTNQWFWSLGRPLVSRSELIKKLRSFRTENELLYFKDLCSRGRDKTAS